ncbi:hypothetical protein OG339_42295 [Streptosporangium sp. NBC_01495]|uniref:zinc finger domain-containing protein n=1 Tax=Streptosporangium sp. NBC_01495 TaxID=2903899 RepID=UPI002E33F975|nr:hypothetical protein [Streptosporangium sp. NBC_01495]
MNVKAPATVLPLLTDTALFPGVGPRNAEEARRYKVWKFFTAAPLTACPTCGNSALEPCRTLGPRRITCFHIGRLRAVATSTRAQLTQAGNDLLASLPEVFAMPLSSLPLRERLCVGLQTYDEAAELRFWKLSAMRNLVVCHTCCAKAAEPCRTSKGRVPGRITSAHNPRFEALKACI